MNAKKLGLLRELLTAASAALIAYGYGTESLWQEAAGGIVAAICLIWGVVHNEGTEAWFSLARKVLSSVSGVLVLTGTIAPDKAQVLIGLVGSAMAMLWSAAGKPTDDPASGSPPPTVPLILLLACSVALLPSCAEIPAVPISIVTPWGSGSKDALGNVSLDTPYASGSKDAITGQVTIAPKAPIVINAK